MRELSVVEKQWIFSPDTLGKTPSAAAGFSTEKELQKRKSTIIQIRGLAKAAGLFDWRDPNHHGGRGVMTVAATLVHRFYMRRSFKDFSEEIMAGTILFLASKIEEQPLKLRHICNSCLDRFQHAAQYAWHPAKDGSHTPVAPQYKKWEDDILATEEVVLETLCFDMGIEQPWVVLKRSLRGLDGLGPNKAESSRQAEERAQAIEELSEGVIAELGWAILNEAYLSPLPVLYPATILAFSTFAIITALIGRTPLPAAIRTASELADRFGLDIRFSEAEGVTGQDLQHVKLCLDHFLEYCKAGLVDEALVALIPAEPEQPTSGPFERRFHIDKPASPAQSDTKTPLAIAKDPSPKRSSEGTKTPAQSGPTPPSDVIMSPQPEESADLFGDPIPPISTSISPPRY